MNDAAEKCAVSRERYWEECDAEQKADRLRDEVSRLCRLVTQQTKIIAKLSIHQHAADGRLMTLIAQDLEDRGPGLFAHDDGIPHSLRTVRERR